MNSVEYAVRIAGDHPGLDILQQRLQELVGLSQFGSALLDSIFQFSVGDEQRIFGPLASSDVVVDQDDFLDLTTFIFQWVNRGGNPTLWIAMTGLIGNGFVRVVLNCWDVRDLSGKTTLNERQNSLGRKLLILKDVVLGNLR